MSEEERNGKSSPGKGRLGVARTQWVAFSEDTSMHGLVHAVGRPALWKRLGWSLLVMGGFAMAIYNLTQTLQDFMEHPVSTKLSMEHDPSAAFPAVTICNVNRFHRAKLEKVYDLNAKLTKWTKAETSNSERRFELDLDLRKNYTETELVTLGHTLDDMLIECTHSGIECDKDSFKASYDFKYGNCFTFNTYASSDNQEDVENAIVKQTRPGADSGLALELDIEQMEYLPMTATAGVIVVVHTPGQMAFPVEEGMAAGPGMATSIGVRKTEMKREPPPYSRCMSIEGEDAKRTDMYAKVYGYKYTGKGCRKTCQQKMTYLWCDCCDMSFPCVEEILQSQNASKKGEMIPWCVDKASEEKDNRTLNCLSSIASAVLEGYLLCDNDQYDSDVCLLPCDEVTYSVRVTQALWPSLAHRTDFIRKANVSARRRGKNFTFTGDPDEYVDTLADTMVRIEVFFEQLNYQRIESVPTYTWNRLLGDIGGQLGLYLGFSMLTAVEWIEFLGDLIAAVLCNAQGKVDGGDPASWADPKVGL